MMKAKSLKIILLLNTLKLLKSNHQFTRNAYVKWGIQHEADFAKGRSWEIEDMLPAVCYQRN